MEKGLNEVCDCKQSVFAYIFQQYGLEQEVVATGRLLFEYDVEITDAIIGGRIRPYPMKPVPWFSVLDIQEEKIKLSGNSAIIDKYLEAGISCVMTGDLYNCDWSEAYHKYHFKHYWLITRKEDNDYVISDTYFGKNDIKKNMKELLQLETNVAVYISNNFHSSYEEKIGKIIKEDANYYLERKMDEKISIFAKDLLNVDLCDEMTCADLYAVPLLDNLKSVGKQRGAYAFLIDSMSGRLHIDCKVISCKLRESKLWWEKIYFSLTKSIIRRKRSCDINFIEEALGRIRVLETEVIKELTKI